MTQTTGAQQLNLLQANLFKVTIQPHFSSETDPLDRQTIEMWTNKVPVAARSIDIVTVATPIQNIDFPTGGKHKFEEFSLTFLLTEELENYITLVQWMERNNPYKQISSQPTSIDFSTKKDVKEWLQIARNEFPPNRQWEPKDYRDIYITLKNLSNITFGHMVYYEAFPVSIPSFTYDNASSEPIEITVTFKYLYSDIILVDKTSVCR